MDKTWNFFLDYTFLGVEHIWTGYDHLLFLLAVMIGTGTKGDYVKILTSFTVGHSITLALASGNIVFLSSKIIEPLIALSIVLAAAESMWRKSLKGRWPNTLVFGLVHGFGFAGILQGFQSSNFALALFSFNLGVEIGQLAIAVIAVPILLYIRTRTKWEKQFKYIFSAVIGIFGFYWFGERTFPFM